MKSVMSHNFSQVPKVQIPRSVFDRSHGYKTTFDSGYLVPFFVDEALPGDSFTASATMFARLATPIKPFMDNLFLETFYFAVPYRLVWENWQKFNGEQDYPEEGTDYLVPQIESPDGGFTAGSIEDYFALPLGVDNLSVSVLWHRAYNLIYNEWFRDQNLITKLVVPKDDGPDNQGLYYLQKRCKRHDYFTSALPWPQKGPGVEIPLGTAAAVYGNGKALGFDRTYGTDAWYNMGAYYNTTYAALGVDSAAFNQPVNTVIAETENPQTDQAMGILQKSHASLPLNDAMHAESGLYADLSSATAATINSLRQAFQLQRLYERDARGGTRYTEIIKSHFGVTSPDSRLQRPEYLGGSSSRININPVQKTSSTDTTSPQGNLAAYGLGTSNGGFTKSFTEHTLIIGLVNVRADLTYQRGIPRMFSRQTRWDFYWPSLAHLGEQEILNKEIYAQGIQHDDAIFGYQERFAEYRYYPSQITGKFRSTDPQSLDVWHLSQDFESAPVLNRSFIEENPPIDRVIAVPSEPQFLLDVYMNLKCARPMPVYSVPGMIDHF